MRNRTGYALRIAAFSAIAIGSAAAEDLPAWLKDLPSATLPSYPAKVNAVVLFNEEHTTALDSGRLSTTTRTAIKLLNRQGGDILFLDQYDSASGKVRDFRAWMIAASGKVKKFGKDEIVDITCAENDVYNECRQRVVSGKRDAEAGAVFAYESVIEYESFSNQLWFRFQDSAPARLARMIVTVPPGWEVKAQSFNGAPEARAAGGEYTWQMENLAPLELEPASPSIRTLAPALGVSLTPPRGRKPVSSWQEAAQLLSDLSEGQFEPDADMTAKAKALTEGASTEFEKIRAIGKFVQQVNYVSVQTNLAKGGGYRPHPATQVFQKLYGDCKDKANLMRAMLKAVGIAAYPVAIYSGDRTHVTEGWPSLGAFNHAISAIKVSEKTDAPAVLEHPRLGRILFFDPTDSYVPVGQIPDHEQASLALVGAGAAGDLVRVPAGAVDAANRHREVEAALSAEGIITGRFTETRTGEERSDALAAFRSLTRPEYEKSVERWVGTSIPGSTVSGIETVDKDPEFVLKAEFTSKRFGQRPQPRMLIFRPALLAHGDLRLVEKTRKYPVVLSADALKETVRIQTPPGLKLDELPEPVKIQSRFGSYEAAWKWEAGTVFFSRALQIPAQTVPVADYAELRKFLDAISATEESPVVLMQ